MDVGPPDESYLPAESYLPPESHLPAESHLPPESHLPAESHLPPEASRRPGRTRRPRTTTCSGRRRRHPGPLPGGAAVLAVRGACRTAGGGGGLHGPGLVALLAASPPDRYAADRPVAAVVTEMTGLYAERERLQAVLGCSSAAEIIALVAALRVHVGELTSIERRRIRARKTAVERHLDPAPSPRRVVTRAGSR